MRLLCQPSLVALSLCCLFAVGAGCGDMASPAGGMAADEAGGDLSTETDLPDDPMAIVGDTPVEQNVFTGQPVDAGGAGTGGNDAGPEHAEDAGGGEDDDAGPVSTAHLKDDDTYLVPPGVAARSELTLGAGVAAWVQHDALGEPPRLVVWDLTTLDPPAELTLPFLAAPRDLVLGDGWLFYVDDRYGDADVFALRLEDSSEHPVATLPGDQDQPAASGTTVAWRDCRACVAGAGDAPAEIYRLDVAADDAVEERLTDDSDPDQRPVFGTLGDGSTGLAWLTGTDRLQALSVGGALTTLVAPAKVAALALTDGVISWRESVSIINPDSMMPDDVFGTPIDGGETFAYSEHAELFPGLDGAPSASAGQVAWLESVPGEVPLSRVVIADAVDATVLEVVEGTGIDQPRLSSAADFLAFIAPRADNGGQDDVWVLPLGD